MSTRTRLFLNPEFSFNCCFAVGTKLLEEGKEWGQTRKSAIPVPPIPDLAGKRRGNFRFPTRPGTGIGKSPVSPFGRETGIGVPIHRQKGLGLQPGARGFFDSESNLPRLKSTHVADCKPQAPPGRRWDFALELGLGLLVQNIREPAGWLRS